jgi:serine/threonine protein kinase
MSKKVQDPDIGRKIGSYQIVSVLGAGGMGKVFQARHTMIGKEVAIKLLNKEHSRDKESVDRFFREARVANEIKHENIIDTLDFGQTEEGECYLVMELLAGKSLARLLAEQKGGPLPQEKIAHIGLQLCSALYAAHQHSVIHRDIKSDNVFLVTRAGQRDFVKVLDFGIARINREDSSIATNTGTVLGTPMYLSPEQALGQKVGPSSDIYSLGVLFYLMASGTAPFYDANPISLAMMHVMVKPEPLTTRYPTINPLLNECILRCLEKKIEDRYQTMLDVAIALGAACGVDPASYFGQETTQKSPPESTKADIEVGGVVAATTAARGLRRPSYPLFAALSVSVIAAALVVIFGAAHSSASKPESAAALLPSAVTIPASLMTQPAAPPSSSVATLTEERPSSTPVITPAEAIKKKPKAKLTGKSPENFDGLLVDPTEAP